MRKSTAACIAVLSLVLTVYTVSKSGLLLDPESYQADHLAYLYHAEHPFAYHIAPFCWRVAVPFLARLLPFADIRWNFLTISLLSIWATGIGLYYLARSTNYRPAYAILGTLLFFAMPSMRNSVWNFYLPDALSFAVITFCVLMIYRRQFIGLALLMAFGAAVKETALFAIPLVYSLTAQKLVDWPAARRAALVALPAVVVTIAIRLLIPSYNYDPVYVASLSPRLVRWGSEVPANYDYLYLIKTVVIWRLTEAPAYVPVTDYFLTPFGVAFFLPWLAVRRNGILLLRFLPFVLAVYAQLLVALNTDRLLVLAFPAVILLNLNALSNALHHKVGREPGIVCNS